MKARREAQNGRWVQRGRGRARRQEGRPQDRRLTTTNHRTPMSNDNEKGLAPLGGLHPKQARTGPQARQTCAADAGMAIENARDVYTAEAKATASGW